MNANTPSEPTVTITYEKGARFEVFNIKESQSGGAIWVRAGSAWVNRDGSISVYLDVLPLDGKLHLRQPLRKVAAEPTAKTN